MPHLLRTVFLALPLLVGGAAVRTAEAQRALAPALITAAGDTTGAAVGGSWLRRTDDERSMIRAGTGLAGGLLGGTAGVAVVYALSSSTTSHNDGDLLGALVIIALGETIGVSTGAAMPGGNGHRACGAGVRQLRSLAGTLVGTAAGIAATSHARSDGVLLFIPAAQITGAVLALTGC